MDHVHMTHGYVIHSERFEEEKPNRWFKLFWIVQVRWFSWGTVECRRVRKAFGVEKNKDKLIFSTLLVVRLLRDIIKIHQNQSMRTLLKCAFQWISPPWWQTIKWDSNKTLQYIKENFCWAPLNIIMYYSYNFKHQIQARYFTYWY